MGLLNKLEIDRFWDGFSRIGKIWVVDAGQKLHFSSILHNSNSMHLCPLKLSCELLLILTSCETKMEAKSCRCVWCPSDLSAPETVQLSQRHSSQSL